MKANPGDPQHTVDFLDITFDIRHEILCRLDLPHIQCGPEGAEQSSGDTGNHVIKRRRILRARDLAAVLFLVEVLDAAMNSEVKRLVKPLDARRSVRTFVFGNLDSAGMRDGHSSLLREKCFYHPHFRQFTATVKHGKLIGQGHAGVLTMRR